MKTSRLRLDRAKVVLLVQDGEDDAEDEVEAVVDTFAMVPAASWDTISEADWNCRRRASIGTEKLPSAEYG